MPNKQEGVIKELDSIEAVRERYSMFIGNRGVTQLLSELIDNSKDEALAGYCNKIDIFIKNDPDTNEPTYYIRDNGRGFPLFTENGDDGIVSVCTKLYSGGKYTDMSLYKSGSSGANGLGLVVTNALSKYLTITTLAKDKDNNHWQYYFKNGKYITRQLVHLTCKNKENLYSTEIKFIPDFQYFKKDDAIDLEEIKRRLIIARYVLNDDIIINFNGVSIEDTYLDSFKGDNCINFINQKYTSKKTNEKCQIDIALYDDFDSGKIFKGIVNTLESNEGTHKNILQNLLKSKLYDIAEKNKKHIQPNDIFVPIRLNCVLQLKHIDFEEQVKNTLSNDKGELIDLIEPCLDELIKKNKDFFNAVINKTEEYRINLESSKQARKNKLGKSIIVKGLRDCSSRNPLERSIYLVEGDSAAGCMIKARNPHFDAILPLRGKLLNVLQATKNKIIENDVINNIANSLGYKIFQNCDPFKCRYQKGIFICCDADFDGSHITCLLIFVFYKLFPELIKSGLVYIVQTPLYGCTVKKQFIPIYTIEDRQKYNNQNIITRRYKGLGEMMPNQLKESAFNNNVRRCLQLKWEDFDLLKLWNDEMGKLVYEE